MSYSESDNWSMELNIVYTEGVASILWEGFNYYTFKKEPGQCIEKSGMREWPMG